MKVNCQLPLFLGLFLVLLIGCKSSETQPAGKSEENKILGSPNVIGVLGASIAYDDINHIYTITVPSGTSIKSLKIELNVSTGATISPDPNVEKDYTNPVEYFVTAENGSKQKYTIKVEIASGIKSSAKEILEFNIIGLKEMVVGIIDKTSRTISATVPSDTDLSSLNTAIQISDKASVLPASGSRQNFTNAVQYIVTAEDGTKQVYEVTVRKQTGIVEEKKCLLSRIESVDTKEYMDFEYNANGQIIKISAIHLEDSKLQPLVLTLTYGAGGDLSGARDSDGVIYTPIYQNEKLVSTQTTYPKGGTDDWFVAVNDSNQIIKTWTNCCPRSYIYEDGSTVKLEERENFGENVPIDGTTIFEHKIPNLSYLYPQRFRPGFLHTFFEFNSLNEINYIYLAIYYGRSCPSSLEIFDNKTQVARLTFRYMLNQGKYPIEIQILNDPTMGNPNLIPYVNCKLYYSNCPN